MTGGRPRWNRAHSPAGLLQYVRLGLAGRLLERPLPVPSDGPPMERARQVYQAFAAAGIHYVGEPPGSEPGRQQIRPPDQVLLRPRHATCLDLAVTYAGACLDAGLHPIVVLLDGERPEQSAHALVVVWLGGDWDGAEAHDYPLLDGEGNGVLHPAPPAELLDDLREAVDRPGAFLAVEVTGAASAPDGADPARRTVLSWDQAVATGAQLLRTGADRWSAGIDVGIGQRQADPFPLPDHPPAEVLAPPYLPLPAGSGPLRQLSARHDVVAFHPRDELDLLLDWCQEPDTGADGAGPTRIALLHGVGGAGKTRLAAETARRLAALGWCTGFLLRASDPQDLAWLGRVVSPLLVVVDYAEEARAEEVIRLLRAVRERRGPTCLLLTARSVSGWWHDEIADALAKEAHPHVLRDLPLTARHPRAAGVYRAALRSFGTHATASGAGAGTGAGAPDWEPEAYRWTTLDLVMLAWLAAQGEPARPESEQDLYAEILRHELAYWKRAYRTQIGGKPPEALLRAAGACVSLLGPGPARLQAVLGAVGPLAEDARWRTQIADLLAELLPPAAEDGSLAIRPDPVGAHLLSEVFGADEDLLRRSFAGADEEERLNGCTALSRIGGLPGAELGRRLAESALRAVPELWRPALAVASTRGGPFVAALETLAAEEDTPLPLEVLREILSAGYVTTRQLALIVTTRLAPAGRAEGADEEAWAGWLVEYSLRQGEAGDRRGALASVEEAVAIRRRLAVEEPTEQRRFQLAVALDRLGVTQAEAGRREAAVVSGRRAVALVRRLSAEGGTDLAAALAEALHNLSVHQRGIGERDLALRTSAEAVRRWRAVGGTEAVAALARALHGLSICQTEAGELQQAVHTALEAVELDRRLAEEDPAAHLPGLANALNGLSNQLSAAGEPRRALAAIAEATEIRRMLVRLDPDAHLEDLAGAMVNLSVQRYANGDRTGAAATSRAAVELLRGLADRDAEVFRPALGVALQNLGYQLAAVGDAEGALAAAEESVALHRELVPHAPQLFLPQLAAVLSNRSVVQQETGDAAGALASAEEAVALYRQLASGHPEVFRPLLARTLANLAVQRARSGDRSGAHTLGQEAVDLFTGLAEEDPGSFRAALAGALTNLSHHQRDLGDRRAALDSARQAVALRRALARIDPAHVPELAGSLSTLAASLTELGDLRGALATEEEAAGLQWQLVALDRGGHLAGLARVLHNLSLSQLRFGDRSAGLQSARDAVELQREVTRTNPGGGREGLAKLLNTLSIQQREAGELMGALASSLEAVDLQEQLAGVNPAAFLPELAGMLGALANNQSAVGELAAALDSSRRSVAVRETLAAAEPAAFLPDLAASLGTLSVHQVGSGDGAGALVSATRAVEIRRVLAEAEPAAFRPGLARSLHNLAVVRAGTGGSAEATAPAEEAVRIARDLVLADVEPYLPALRLYSQLLLLQQAAQEGLPEAVRRSDAVLLGLPADVRAQLLTDRAALRARRGDGPGALADLAEAARRIDEGGQPVRAGEVRGAVRELLAGLREELTDPQFRWPRFPAWAELATDAGAREFIDRWRTEESWEQRSDLVAAAADRLLDPAWRDTLAVARAIHPEEECLDGIADLLDLVAELGVGAAVQQLRTEHELVDLLCRWLVLDTWREGHQYLLSHPELRTDPLARELLEGLPDDPAARLHLAVLRLADHVDPAEVYDAAVDPAAAADLGVTLLEQGRVAALADLFLLAPMLHEQPFTGGFLGAVHALLTPAGADRAAGLMRTAAAQATEVQRGAGTVRLRRLADRCPELGPALVELGTILAAGGRPATPVSR
ncbi:tetratricopeptide repeat protein [Kitasatospora sp. NPDC002040]|uniref:tetratricopeptide repeat protein n=1 Tax=Kitasatospora sp. NPDC002040 TaxID=3154661 RepID=UPI0033230CFA